MNVFNLSIFEALNHLKQFRFMPKPHLKQTLFFLFSLTHAFLFAQITDEATYFTKNLQRLNLPIAGEVWYYADDSARQIRLFDGNHSPWKTIDYPSEANKTVSLLNMNMPISDTIFNTDNLLEFVWQFSNSTGKRIKVMNERNQLVYAFSEDANLLTVNELVGSPTKLFVEHGQYYYDGSNLKTSIYSLPSLVLDTTFINASDMRRQKFSYAGEKFYFKNRETNSLEIYNPNYTRWKPAIKIHKIRNELNYPDPVFFADDKTFNADTSVECMFTYWHANGWPLTKIVSEKDITTKIAYANSNSHLILDRKIGYPDKLFLLYQGTGSSTTTRSEVYSLPQMRKETTVNLTYIGRIILKQFGAKYITFEGVGIKLSDTLHRTWKSVPLRPTSNFGVNYWILPLICDSIVNPDNQLEVIWSEQRNSNYNVRITKENGDDLAIIPNTYHFQVSQLDNLPNKLITKMMNGTTKVWRFTPRTSIQDPSVVNDLDVQVSPNPFVSSFTIHCNNTEYPLSIRLFNAVGQLVFSEKNVQTGATITPPQALSKGIYLLDIVRGEKRVTQRLIKL